MGEYPTVGFDGVGMMGWSMAKRHRKGAVEVVNVEEMAKTADIIVLCAAR